MKAAMKTLSKSSNPTLIAPCGINCRLCHAYIREKNACPSCRGDDTTKMKSCLSCKIKNCENMAKGQFEYCFECGEFPCILLSHLDKRYRSRYGLSVLENLVSIQEVGIMNFVKNENEKWACHECGAMICMHKPQCLSCGYVWYK